MILKHHIMSKNTRNDNSFTTLYIWEMNYVTQMFRSLSSTTFCYVLITHFATDKQYHQ